jgi:hypothetical protein
MKEETREKIDIITELALEFGWLRFDGHSQLIDVANLSKILNCMDKPGYYEELKESRK